MQQLRIWRNASEHHDEARWDREGPRSEDAFVALGRREVAYLRAGARSLAQLLTLPRLGADA